jgi:anti-sigma B factor antagonist
MALVSPARKRGTPFDGKRDEVLRLRCLACGLTVPYKGSEGDLCPRCLVRDEEAVALIPVSDQPSSVFGGTMGRLRIYTRVHGDCHTIFLSGEVDVSSSQMLEEAVVEACAAGARELVLDMGGIEFMDSTGLRAILRGKTLCEARDCDYRLTPAQRPVEQTLAVTGVRAKLQLRKAGRRGSRHTASPSGEPQT